MDLTANESSSFFSPQSVWLFFHEQHSKADMSWTDEGFLPRDYAADVMIWLLLISVRQNNEESMTVSQRGIKNG